VTRFGGSPVTDALYPIIALFDGPVDQPSINPDSWFGAVINAANVTAWDPTVITAAARTHQHRLLSRLAAVESGEMTFVCAKTVRWRLDHGPNRVIPDTRTDLTVTDLALNEPARFVRHDPDNKLRWVMAGIWTGTEITVDVETVTCDPHQNMFRSITNNTVTETTGRWREHAETVLRDIARSVDTQPSAVSSDGRTVTVPWQVLEALLVGRATNDQIGAIVEAAMFVNDQTAPTPGRP
jgi:hypothetical protein